MSTNTKADAAVGALLEMYRERHAELSRVVDIRATMPEHPWTDDQQRIWNKRGEQVEYLFGCLDGLRMAINHLDPTAWKDPRWRDFSAWEESLPEGDGAIVSQGAKPPR